MVKDQEYLKEKAFYCIDYAKKKNATDVQIILGNSISETVNFRNKNLNESERSDSLSINLTVYIGKKKSTISSSNLSKENLVTLIERCIDTTKIIPEDEFNSLPDNNLLAKDFKELDLYDHTHLSNDKKIDDYLLANKIKDLGLSNDLINHKGLTLGMLVTLGEQKILSLTDFADLASDELTGVYDVIKGERVKIKGYLEDFALSKNEADELIMSARNKIYQD